MSKRLSFWRQFINSGVFPIFTCTPSTSTHKPLAVLPHHSLILFLRSRATGNRQAKMSRRRTLPVLILCCVFASQALLSTAFIAGRSRSKNIGRTENTKAQLTFVDADLASASDLLANVADHHLLIADSATANDVAANYKTPGGFIFLAYILFSFWAGGVELVKRVQNWQEKKQEE